MATGEKSLIKLISLTGVGTINDCICRKWVYFLKTQLTEATHEYELEKTKNPVFENEKCLFN